MRSFATLCLLLCGLAAMESNVATTQHTFGTSREIEQAFSSGKVVVLVIAPPKSAGEKDESEAYGDWADNLNGFASSAPPDIQIIRLTPARYRQEVEEPKIRRTFATVFLRDSTHALLYDGMIVEAKAYKVGDGWLHQHPDDKAITAYGLQEKPAKLK